MQCSLESFIMLLGGTAEMTNCIPWLVLALIGSIGKVLLQLFYCINPYSDFFCTCKSAKQIAFVLGAFSNSGTI
ncbi:hypothetical protein [Lachnotalea glycerini]|uniref:hypothetical protein n=1 Tax=Lachnotalea glycerini TaxID=1763509 RepID=UPI000D7630E6|nr:hypothetical protein [Lachnotalea glycerini]